MAENNYNVREVEFNNKSRKGKYVYVKKKGERGSYYKKKEGLVDNDYINIKRLGGVYNKRKGVPKKKAIDKYIRRLSETKKVEEIISKGYNETEVKNVENLTPYSMRKAYVKLLTKPSSGKNKKIVDDSELAYLLARPENVEKWKHRIEYVISLKEGEKTLATLTASHRGKSVMSILTDLKGAQVNKGLEIRDFSPTVKTKLEPLGYKYSHMNNGQMTRIDMKLVFRKG